MSTPLTKKQQKAQAFRAKQKAKAKGLAEPEDVPEADLDVAAEAADGDADTAADEVTVAVAVSSGKKRKRAGEDEDEDKAKANTGKGKGKEKAKAKTAWDEDEEGDGAGGMKKAKNEVKQRFILFVGNLDYKTTAAEVAAHFQEAIGRVPSVRLLTHKADPSRPGPPKSRGIAFLELASSGELQLCLRLQGSALKGRPVNVELTAGGGGKGEARRGKIEERKKRMGGQRERRAEREAEEGKEDGAGAGPGQAQGQQELPRASRWPAKQDEAIEGYRVRGGRRVKVTTDTGGRNGKQQGWARREQSGAPRAGGPGGKRKWEPTGANATHVG
ncbi:hypothetical protein Q5752_002416 [Cryptotrichosporon argae]